MSLSIMDWLRIESAVSTVNFHIQDLPERRRRTIRRELRANLRAAAVEVGARESVRRLGNLRRVAADYLDAEYGTGPRPRWVSGLQWAALALVVMAFSLVAGSIGFFEGVRAAAPLAGGTYAWHPFGGAGPSMDFTVLPNDDGWAYGLYLGPWPFILYICVFLVAARWWRLLGLWRRRRATSTGQPSGH